MRRTTVIFARHAQTEGNERKLVQSWTDFPLTPKGHAQATALAAALASEEIGIVITADNDRSAATADPTVRMLEARGLHVPLLRLADFNEGSAGELDGLSSHDPRFVEARTAYFLRGGRYPGGETQEEVRIRLFRGITQALRIAEDRMPLIVSSGSILKLLPAWHFGWPPEDMLVRSIPNATPFRATFDVDADGAWSVAACDEPRVETSVPYA